MVVEAKKPSEINVCSVQIPEADIDSATGLPSLLDLPSISPSEAKVKQLILIVMCPYFTISASVGVSNGSHTVAVAVTFGSKRPGTSTACDNLNHELIF